MRKGSDWRDLLCTHPNNFVGFECIKKDNCLFWKELAFTCLINAQLIEMGVCFEEISEQ